MLNLSKGQQQAAVACGPLVVHPRPHYPC